MVFAGNCDVEGCKAQFTNLQIGGSQNIESVAGSVVDVDGVIHAISQFRSAGFRGAKFVYGVPHRFGVAFNTLSWKYV